MYPAHEPSLRVRYVLVADGVRVRIAESGDASRPAVLLVHGWGASIYMWRHWFAPLAAAGYRVVAVDLPGHGLSDKPESPEHYRLDGQVAALRALIAAEALRGAHIVAQSMGGTIALEVALARASDDPADASRLILVNPANLGRVRMQPLARLASPPLIERVLHRLVPRWIVARAHRLAYGDPRRITARDEDEYWAPSQFPSYSRAMRRLLHEFTWERPPAGVMATRLRSLRRAPLVIIGRRDNLVLDARPYAEELRAAGVPLELVEIDDGGHAVNEELPDRVIPVALEFLRRE